MVWTWRAIVLSLALHGCALAHDVDAERGRSGAPSSPIDLDGACLADLDRSLDGLPDDLACAGLYADVAGKEVAGGVEAFQPAVPLWSDGSGKRRWIYLPDDTRIDASDADEWVFPVGTKLFKEFEANGRRVETRLLQKTRDDHWAVATYEWNEDETAAARSFGGDRPDVQLNGSTYHVPTGSECDQCHEGRREFILGFEMISLGLEGATGMTLQKLIDDDLIEPAPERTELAIGDDGTGLAAEALGWLHVNCGISCHNDNENAEAYPSGLRLKLDQALLDGRASAGFEILRTTVGVPAMTPRWNQQQRIVAGAPEQSLLYQLVSVRRPGRNNQMPPIATRVVPEDEVQLLADWIRAMGNRGQTNAGGPD